MEKITNKEKNILILNELEVNNFRCFHRIKANFTTNIVCIFGDNANGKSSFLEAIYFLHNLSSPLSSETDDCLKFDQNTFNITGKYSHSYTNQTKDIESRAVEFIKSPNKTKRYSVNGKEIQRVRDYIQNSPVAIWLSAKDIELAEKGGARARRNFLDEVCILQDVSYLHLLRRHNKLLRMRNAALRDPRCTLELINTYDVALAPCICKLLTARMKTMIKLNENLPDIQNAISGSKDDLSLTFYSDFVGTLPVARDVFAKSMPNETMTAKRLRASIELDMRLGTSSCGAHHDDFIPFLNAKNIFKFSSDGQKICFAIGLKLNLANLQNSNSKGVCLLVDDVLAKLDDKRKENFYKIVDPRIKLFISSPNEELINMKFLRAYRESPNVFIVKNGVLKSLEKN